MNDASPPAEPAPPTFEEAFRGDDTLRIGYPVGLRVVFLGITLLALYAVVGLVHAGGTPTWFVLLHGAAGTAFALATANLFLRADRLSAHDVETRSLFGTRRVAWADVTDAVVYDQNEPGHWWPSILLIASPGLLGLTSHRIYDAVQIPHLAGWPFALFPFLLVTLGCGAAIVILGLWILLTRARRRLGLGRSLVLRDASGRSVFELATWPRKSARGDVERVLRHVGVPVQRGGNGHRA